MHSSSLLPSRSWGKQYANLLKQITCTFAQTDKPERKVVRTRVRVLDFFIVVQGNYTQCFNREISHDDKFDIPHPCTDCRFRTLLPMVFGKRWNQRTIWVFPKIGGTPKWIVKKMENPIKMDDFGGTTILGNPHIMNNWQLMFSCFKIKQNLGWQFITIGVSRCHWHVDIVLSLAGQWFWLLVLECCRPWICNDVSYIL